MSAAYDAILERKLGRKLNKANAIDATTSVNINAKGLSLKNSFIELKSTDVFAEGVVDDAFNAASERLDDILENIVMGQRFFDKKTETTKFAKKGRVKIPGEVRGLRNKAGQFISGLQLSVILNSTLDNYISQLMGHDGRLERQSGRLSNSAQVTGIRFQDNVANQRENKVSIFFNYMIAPYSVFEEGGRQHKPGRSPSILIKEALHLALRNALSKTSFNNNVFANIYKGRRF